MIPIPGEIQAVLDTLRAAGFEACPVGGCVRDRLMGKVPEDWDVCTSALPDAVLRLFGEAYAVPTGLKHGTVTVRSGNRSVEITTYRVDGAYADHRKPDAVRFTPSLREDLCRRDFTVNAMALDETGSVIDLFGGRADLQAGILRCVGDPETRFREDALRILRGLRFAGKLDFAVEPATEAAMRALCPTLRLLSPERVQKELRGLLLSPGCSRVFRDYGDILSVVLPGVDFSDTEAVSAAPADFCLRFALLCGQQAAALSEKLRCSGEEQRRIARFRQALALTLTERREDMARLAALLGWADSALLRGDSPMLRALRQEPMPLTVRELSISGGELRELGYPDGPQMGQCLNALLRQVQAGTLQNDAASLREAAQTAYKNIVQKTRQDD